MKIIGITGGIGTGKSTVLNILKQDYQAYIIETDKLAHYLMEPDKAAYKEIVKVFGKEILNSDSTLNRDKLGKIVFSNKQKLNKLNSIVHPSVKEYIKNDIEEKELTNKIAYYVIEAALLIEDGYRMICDELWYIHTDKEERIRRLIQGRGGDREKWETIIDNQSEESYYQDHCDYVINNGKTIENTQSQINEILS